uniref:P-type ATPase N-terminal domain-containing protein n=1 Tax=Poecilia reticulata TaxID=8081 RepID=A0A3P9PD14_POERE
MKEKLYDLDEMSLEELKQLLKLYQSNKIRTTKYSFLSFLPKNLFEQLHRFANVYFIFLAALNFIPIVEAFEPEVSLIPILLVLSVTAVKDIFEDHLLGAVSAINLVYF